MSRIDVLNFEFTTMSRDTNIVEPVLCYLEVKHKFNIIRESYTNYMLKLYKYRPKMLILSNYTGAPENFKVAKQAHKMGIKVVSLISEGNVTNAKAAGNFFWGWNEEKENVVDILLIWSERTRKLFYEEIPESRSMNVVVSGATGFDRYKMLSFMDKSFFLQKYKRNEKRIIGIAAWGFEGLSLESDSLSGEYVYTLEETKYLLETRNRINDIYNHLISNNTDVLFILKYHPGNIDCHEETEFVGLSKYDNVIEIDGEEQISDLINVSDLWMAFESTTTLEAWLLGKSTIVVNPLGKEFTRAQIYDGSLELHSVDEVQRAIDELYLTGHISDFDKKREIRANICKEIVEYSDGKNHVRAAEEIIKIFDKNICIKNTFSRSIFRELLLEIKYFLLSRIPIVKQQGKIRQYNERKLRYSYSDRKAEVEKYTKAVELFDSKESS